MPFLTSVAGIPARYNVGPLTVRRPGLPTQNQFGDFDDAAASTFQLDPVAAVQSSGRDLLQDPDSDRNAAMTEFYTQVRLHVADGGQIADRVQYRSRWWRITKVEDYDLQGAVYCCTGTLEETGQP